MRELTMKRGKAILGLVFLGAVGVAIFLFNKYGIMLDLEMIKMYRTDIEGYLMKNLLWGVLIFALMYISVIGLSLPFATPLTVLSGFLFGTVLGTAVVAAAASLGATLSVILNRFFFRDFIEHKFAQQLHKLNIEVTGHGFRDILILRLTPIVPFALINIASALTKVRIRDFFFATLVGTIPFTFVYVNAGTQIANLESISSIISPKVIVGLSLVVVAVTLPLFMRRRS